QIEKFIEQGGKVFLDQSAKIQIEGAQTLPVDFSQWHQAIQDGKRPIVTPTEPMYRRHRALREGFVNDAIAVMDPVLAAAQPSVQINSTEAAHTFLQNGDTRYLFVFNTNTDRGQSFRVTLRDLPPVVYDIEASRELRVDVADDGAARVDVDLPA